MRAELNLVKLEGYVAGCGSYRVVVEVGEEAAMGERETRYSLVVVVVANSRKRRRLGLEAAVLVVAAAAPAAMKEEEEVVVVGLLRLSFLTLTNCPFWIHYACL